jgi:hypothetical protein
MEYFSERDDVTLANPLGPPRLGRALVEKAIEEAAANFKGGSMHFEEIARYTTLDLGYVVWMERAEVQLVGAQGMARSSFRVTMDFLTRSGYLEDLAPARRSDHYCSACQHHHRPVGAARRAPRMGGSS